jgi:uncharacterized membrane protein YphA (DoxX/SURF4 family)
MVPKFQGHTKSDLPILERCSIIVSILTDLCGPVKGCSSIVLKKCLLMNLLARLEELNKKTSVYGLLVLRVFLGLALFFKGIQFVRNEALLNEVLAVSAGIQKFTWLTMCIPIIHLFGGLMILIGLFTRWVALVQIPIVLGAVLFLEQDTRAYFKNMELPMAIIILILLVVFLFLGDGALSWKRLIQSERNIK